MSHPEEQQAPAPLTPEVRLEVIKQGLLEGLTQDEIAKRCGVCRETISRDFRKWKLTGGWDDWIRAEFSDMHEHAKSEDFIGSYKEIAKLAARTMTQRTEAKIEGFVVQYWAPWQPAKDEDDNVEDAEPEK